jgi:hypothetical protein
MYFLSRYIDIDIDIDIDRYGGLTRYFYLLNNKNIQWDSQHESPFLFITTVL